MRFDQHQIDKQYYKVVLDIFIGEALAPRTLRESNPLSQRTVVRGGVGGVQLRDGVSTFDADGHY